MAQINQSTRTTPRPYRTPRGSFQIKYFQPSTVAGSTAAIAYGDVVAFDVNVASANFRIVKSTVGSGTQDIISSAIVGIAAEPDAGSPTASALSAQAKVGVYLAEREAEFAFPSKFTGATYLSTLVGTRRSVAYDSTNSFYYVASASTAGSESVVITGLMHDEGTSNGVVIARFISTQVSRIISGAF